jgi:membrane protease YdiL (CAAX protease family)
MSPVSKLAVPEALLVFGLVMAYIWKLRAIYPGFWLLPLALIVASHWLRHERPSTLIFRTKNFGACARRFGPALIAIVAAMWGAGLLAGSIRPLGFWGALPSFAAYLPWGWFQQYLLNGYFLKRFDMALSRNAAAILTSALFCVAHIPNWFLMLVTPITSLAAIWVYRRYRNLYFLALAHAMIGFTLFMVVPDTVSHHLRVGPGWYTWRIIPPALPSE